MHRRRRKPKTAWAMVALYGFGGFLFCGFFFSLFLHTRYQIVDRYFWIVMAIVAGPALAAGITAAVTERRARLPKRIGLALAMVLAVVFFMGIALDGAIVTTNAWLDTSRAVEHRSKVLETKRQRRTRDIVVVESWRGSGTEEVYSDSSVLDAKPAYVIVTTRAGLFGLEWVDDVVPATTDSVR